VRPIRNVYEALRTILIGMRITLKYAFARTVTVQYPDMPPTTQPRSRGFHWYEIEKCSACKACARACPVDCIYIENSGPRKIDKESGLVRGGAMTRYAIDYSKCMFCGLCIEPCPTECLHMGDIHDVSGYDKASTLVEFTALAKSGQRTPIPIWLLKEPLPEWAGRLKQKWQIDDPAVLAELRGALVESQPIKKPPVATAAAPAPAPATAPPPAPGPEPQP
jgi:NADH-quinone oxidoreductase subunit I